MANNADSQSEVTWLRLSLLILNLWFYGLGDRMLIIGVQCTSNLLNCLNIYVSFNSQLTPHPQPLPLACGLWDTRKLLPISSVAKSTVEPFNSESDMASTKMLEGMILG